MTITSLTMPPVRGASPAGVRTAAPPAARAANRQLHANPLFKDGASYDEFQIDSGNVDFARTTFGLDADFINLVKAGDNGAHYSVVYHTEGNDLHLDAYRAAAAAGKTSVFATYRAVDPNFDPAQTYKNELITPMGGGRFFSTILASKRLAVPENATAATRRYLSDNSYIQKETVPFSSFGYSKPFGDFFGVPDKTGIQMFDMAKKSFADKFKIFYSLCKESPEYAAYKMGDVLNEVGSAMVLGVVTPKTWELGTKYGIASAITSIGNIGSPAIGIIAESLLGGVVDNAVNSDHPIDALKKLNLINAGLMTPRVAANLAMHPAIVTMTSHPGATFVELYAGSTVLGGVSGVLKGKADEAIHQQLINKARLSTDDFAKNYYTIRGVELSISRALYLGSYTAAVAVTKAFPAAGLPVAFAGAVMWGLSDFVWPLYHQKPEAKTVIDGHAFVHQGDRYIFDSGWEVSFKGGDGRIVRDDPQHFSISLDNGQLYMKNDNGQPVTMTHKRRLKDYLPKFLKPKVLGEKEHWELSNGNRKVKLSRYGNTPYHVNKLSDNEYLLTDGKKPEVFW